MSFTFKPSLFITNAQGKNVGPKTMEIKHFSHIYIEKRIKRIESSRSQGESRNLKKVLLKKCVQLGDEIIIS